MPKPRVVNFNWSRRRRRRRMWKQFYIINPKHLNSYAPVHCVCFFFFSLFLYIQVKEKWIYFFIRFPSVWNIHDFAFNFSKWRFQCLDNCHRFKERFRLFFFFCSTPKKKKKHLNNSLLISMHSVFDIWHRSFFYFPPPFHSPVISHIM